MMGNFGLLALALTITPVQETTDRDLFRLFNNCEPMSLVVNVFGDDEDVKKVGLTKERVQFAVESACGERGCLGHTFHFLAWQ